MLAGRVCSPRYCNLNKNPVVRKNSVRRLELRGRLMWYFPPGLVSGPVEVKKHKESFHA